MQKYTAEDVAQLVVGLGNGVKGAHCLVFADGKLQLLHRFKQPPGETAITTLTQNEMRNGLTSSRWNFIEGQLAKLYEAHKND